MGAKITEQRVGRNRYLLGVKVLLQDHVQMTNRETTSL